MSGKPKEPATAVWEQAIQRLADQQAEFAARWEQERLDRERLEKERAERWTRELAERDAQWAKERKELRAAVGGIGKSQGAHAEQFFYRAMKHTNSFCGIEYQRVSPNLASSSGDIDAEYDIVLHNGDSLVIIEVKYKFQMHDLKTFVHRNAPNFRKVFQEYADKTIYLAVAGFSFERGVIEEAKKLGLAVLQKEGKNIDIDGSGLRQFHHEK